MITKKNASKFVTVLFATFLASTAWGDYIPGTPNIDVGGEDTWKGETDDLKEGGTVCTQFPGNGSSPAKEECWAESILGEDLDYDDSKTETVTWYLTNAGNIAFELAYRGGYYIVKNSDYWMLFENVASLDWGVINGEYGAALNINVRQTSGEMIISHVTEFNGGGDDRKVPEPGSLALLGAGLLGLGLMRRSRRKSS